VSYETKILHSGITVNKLIEFDPKYKRFDLTLYGDQSSLRKRWMLIQELNETWEKTDRRELYKAKSIEGSFRTTKFQSGRLIVKTRKKELIISV
jgi:hypothetical protein